MSKQILTGILFFLCIHSFGTVQLGNAASCPNNESYGLIYYNHQLLNQTISPSGTYSQASDLSGPVGIEIGPTGVVNAGNNMLNRTINLVYTTSKCDCLSEKAESQVTVTVTGTCANGVLNMQLSEVYPNSSAVVTCTGDDSCPVYTQQFPGSTNNFNMSMDYSDGNTVTQPYSCPNCYGTYSWRLQFSSEPPPPEEVPLAPLVPILHLMLRRQF